MVVSGANHVPDVNNIMGGMENTAGVRLHNHRRKLRQRFDLVRKLGQGTYGKVQLGINKETGQEVAIKTIKKAKIETEADLIRIRREIQIMSSVRHPNIIHIYEVFENKEKMVLVMEYAAGGELYDYLSERKVLSETEARRIFRQVASAVYYCHKHKICHRDLKLENILLDETGSAKIADFGLSNVFDERRLLTTFCGSPLYASPEIVRGTPYHGPEVDCWSLGVLLYTLVYGAMPFDGSNFKRLVKQISSGDYYEPKKPSCASPLIRHMLFVEPSKRATVEDICSHWWVNEGYGESCLEVAEELANQTPVRLDLLLSLLPPPTSSDAVVVGKLDTSVSTAPATNDIEGDSMNEYYSAHSNEVTKNVDKEDTLSGKKNKKKKERDKEKEGSKRKREISNADVTNTSKKKETIPSVDGESVASDKEAIPCDKIPAADDSGIQTSEGKKEVVLTTSSSMKTGDVKEVSNSEDAMEVDEGVSISNSWTAANFDPNFHERTVTCNDEKDYPLSQESPNLLRNNSTSRCLENDFNSQNDRNISNENVELDLAKESSQGTSALIESQSKSKNCSFSESGVNRTESTNESLTVEHNSSLGKPNEQQTDLPELQIQKTQDVESQASKSPEPAKHDTEETRVKSPEKQPQEQVLRGRSESSATCAAKPSRQSESRHSKILRQAELFNSLSNFRAEPKNTMTLERPKKVTIYGFKVSDARRAYENKPDSKPMVVPALKVSDAKRAFEIAAATAKSASTSHGSLPRRTLIQTPSSGSSSGKEQQRRSNSSSNHSQRSSIASEDNDKMVGGCSSSEKVVVGGLGVKLGAVGRVSEIGVKVKTEDDTTSREFESKPVAVEPKPVADGIPCVAIAKKTATSKPGSSQITQQPNSTSLLPSTEANNDKVPAVRDAGLVPAISAANKAAAKEEAKIKKLKPVSKLSTLGVGNKEENKEIEVILDIGETEPKLASMLISGSTTLHGKNEASGVQSNTKKNIPFILF